MSVYPVSDLETTVHPALTIGVRVRYKVPERGGFSLGFGKVTKINRKTLTVEDEKNGAGAMTVDKSLVFEIIKF